MAQEAEETLKNVEGICQAKEVEKSLYSHLRKNMLNKEIVPVPITCEVDKPRLRGG